MNTYKNVGNYIATYFPDRVDKDITETMTLTKI